MCACACGWVGSRNEGKEREENGREGKGRGGKGRGGEGAFRTCACSSLPILLRLTVISASLLTASGSCVRGTLNWFRMEMAGKAMTAVSLFPSVT